MTYGISFDISAPIEMYDALHSELLRRTGTSVDGLLVHLARPTAGGFQVIEVWSSRDRLDHYNATVAGPLMAELAGGAAVSPPAQTEEEFEVRGLVLPAGDIGF